MRRMTNDRNQETASTSIMQAWCLRTRLRHSLSMATPQSAPYVALHGHATVTAYTLLHHMELSLLCHELTHLLLGHLLPPGKAAELGRTELTAWDK